MTSGMGHEMDVLKAEANQSHPLGGGNAALKVLRKKKNHNFKHIVT